VKNAQQAPDKKCQIGENLAKGTAVARSAKADVEGSSASAKLQNYEK